MSYDKVKQAKVRTVGTKQTKKAIEQGKALEVFIAVRCGPTRDRCTDLDVSGSECCCPICRFDERVGQGLRNRSGRSGGCDRKEVSARNR